MSYYCENVKLIFFVRSLRQRRLNEVFLQLLVDLLKLPVRLLTVQKTVINGYSQVIDLQIRHNTFFFTLEKDKKYFACEQKNIFPIEKNLQCSSLLIFQSVTPKLHLHQKVVT